MKKKVILGVRKIQFILLSMTEYSCGPVSVKWEFQDNQEEINSLTNRSPSPVIWIVSLAMKWWNALLQPEVQISKFIASSRLCVIKYASFSTMNEHLASSPAEGRISVDESWLDDVTHRWRGWWWGSMNLSIRRQILWFCLFFSFGCRGTNRAIFARTEIEEQIRHMRRILF